MNEADICRTYVLPKLKSAGWEDETISEQMVQPETQEETMEIYCNRYNEIMKVVAYLDSVQARLASLRELQSRYGGGVGCVVTVRAG